MLPLLQAIAMLLLPLAVLDGQIRKNFPIRLRLLDRSLQRKP
ncbi:hypothetical protein [Chroococcidiopsis sp [FACHB-1243]]|nr:hypothetical protein [Chroococcidiopsis sp. [FACHB-1243]]